MLSAGAVFAAHLDVSVMWAAGKGISALTFSTALCVWGGGQWLLSSASSVCAHQQALGHPQGSAPGSWSSGKHSSSSSLLLISQQ